MLPRRTVDEENLLCRVVGDIEELRSAQQRDLGFVHKLEKFVFLISGDGATARLFETFDHIIHFIFNTSRRSQINLSILF